MGLARRHRREKCSRMKPMKRRFDSSVCSLVLLLVWMALQASALACATHCGERLFWQQAHRAPHAVQLSLAPRTVAACQPRPAPVKGCDLPCCMNANWMATRVAVPDAALLAHPARNLAPVFPPLALIAWRTTLQTAQDRSSPPVSPPDRYPLPLRI